MASSAVFDRKILCTCFGNAAKLSFIKENEYHKKPIYNDIKYSPIHSKKSLLISLFDRVIAHVKHIKVYQVLKQFSNKKIPSSAKTQKNFVKLFELFSCESVAENSTTYFP